MNLFGLYRTLRENQEKKNNFLATVVEGPDSGGRLLFSEGQLKSVYGDISLTPEQQEYLTEAGQSQLTGMENRKFFVERLRRPAHLVICGGGHFAVSFYIVLESSRFRHKCWHFVGMS